MSLRVSYASRLTVTETLEGVYVSGGDATVTTGGLDTTATLTASSTPPATKYSAGRLTLSGGAGTINLTSLPDANGVAARVSFEGLELSAYKLRNLSTNGNNILVMDPATTDPYSLFAEFTLRPGEEILCLYATQVSLDSVTSGACNIGISGTGSQVLEFEFVAG